MLQMESSLRMHCPGRSGAKTATESRNWGCTCYLLCCVKRHERPLLTAFCIQAQDRVLMWLRSAVIHGHCFPLMWWHVTVLVHRNSSQEYLCLCTARMWVVIKMNLNYRRITERKQNYYWLKTEPWLCSIEKINQIYGTVETTRWQTFGKCQQWKVLVCVGWH